MKRLLNILIFFFAGIAINAQKLNEARQAVAGLLEPLAEKQLIQQDYSELLNDLVYLYEHPLNLNAATKEDLERIPFLNDYQIENILFYVYNNGPLLTIYELNAVEGLSMETIRQIIPFLKVEPPGFKEAVYKKLNMEAIARGRTAVQALSGYIPPNDTTPSAFAGSKERIFTRIRAEYSNHLFTGLTMEKDPGEPAFSRNIPVMDFMSGYLMFRPKKSILKKIILGDYKASFGQGLGLWTGLAFSKSADVIDLRRRAKGIERYSSLNENSFLRGVAAELKVKNVKIDLFGSYKKTDGTLSGLRKITSLKDDGYHRTGKELLFRKNITETMCGGVVQWQSNSLKIGAGQTYWKISKPLIPADTPYKSLSFHGDSLLTTFAGYSWFAGKVILFGEAALQNFNNISFYQGLTFSPGADVQFALSYRNYSKNYFLVKSNPFAEASVMNGESGIYSAISFSPVRNLTISSYFDMFWYKWLKYRTDGPSTGHEFFLQGNYSPAQNIALTLRYRNTMKQRNKLFYSGTDFPLTDQTLNSVRLQVNYGINENWRLRSRVEQSFFNEENGHSSHGFLFFFDIKHIFPTAKLSADAMITHFDTGDYYSRIYTWEPDVLYSFSIPSFIGNGVRFLFNLNYRPSRWIQLWFRLANTHMPDVDEIGSGYNSVKGKNLTEVKLQVRVKL